MQLITLRNIKLGFGGPLLLDDINLTISPGERVCLVGRNGTGKSTLMKLMSGDIEADDGQVEFSQGIKIARLRQEVPEGTKGSIFDVVALGLGEVGVLLSRYEHITEQLAHASSDELFDTLQELQNKLDSQNAWQTKQQVDTVITRLQLDPHTEFSMLSGGLTRRVLLAQALVRQPDLLLLDEPTNHLDIEAIKWLENFLLKYKGAIVFITHDRMFLQHLATRIIELDRGHLHDWPGDYSNYLRRKQEFLDTEAHQEILFDKKLAQEEIWVRQGIKARRTRNEGRVRELHKLREQRRARRQRLGNAKLNVSPAELSGKIVFDAEDAGFSYENKTIIKDFSTTIVRGDKVALIGPNGSGKTTLLKLLLGHLEPQEGIIKRGVNLDIAYFDQMRNELDESLTVVENVGQGSDSVMINGKSKHIMSYLQDFLFAPERARSFISNLSGGERNRLLLAKLFTKPANLLVMDEPTNDLDAETLDLLEELLSDYQGTLLLVSHDRAFINNVVTSCLVLEGDGKVSEYVGGYDDCIKHITRKAISEKNKPPTKKPASKNNLTPEEQRELKNLPKKIEKLEQAQKQIHQTMGEADFYQQDESKIKQLQAELAAVESALAGANERWEELESR